MTEQKQVKLGPNGKPIRYYVVPKTLSGKLRVWRYMIYRRAVQFVTLLLFFGTFHWGWSLFDKPLLAGNLSGSDIVGLIPLADPFAVLQIFITGHMLETRVIIGALIVLGIYALIGGRVWCSWVCPINPITDFAGWLRNKLGVSNAISFNRNLRYTVLALALILSFITSVAAFEWVSPISMVHRGIVYGLGLGWMAIVGIFLFDLLILKHGWCGHVCPLGAFYAQVGRVAQVRIAFDTPTCTHCGECARVCPEPQVLNLKKASIAHMVASGECTNCGRCVSVCPEDTLKFDLRSHIKKSSIAEPEMNLPQEEKMI